MRETQWQRLLSGKSLVVEAAVPHEEALHGLKSLSSRYEQLSGTKQDRIRILERYPATLLIGMTAVAGQHYDAGSFWPEFTREACLDHSQSLRTEFGNAFKAALAKFQLARFEFPRTYVDEILMHAGIPVSGLHALYRLMAERDRKRPAITGADFIAWLGLKSDADLNAKGIIKPVQRFLTHGRELAIALADDLFSVLDAVGGPSASLDKAVDELPLPLADKTRELVTERTIDATSRTVRRQRDAEPEIVYAQGQVQVRLPGHSGLSDEADYWLLSTSDHLEECTIPVPFPGDSPRAHLIPIPKPSEYIALTRTNGYGSPQSWRLEMIGTRRPFLAFDDEYRLIRGGAELPKSDLWLAFPTSERANPSAAFKVEDHTMDLLEIANTPTGWSDWVFARFDLSGVRRLRLKSEVQSEWVWISSLDRPRLAETPPVPYLRTVEGQPIFDRAPHVVLPRDPRVGTNVRTIAIGRVGDETVAMIEIPSSDQEIIIDPWSKLPHPILGEWDIAVRLGSLGRRRTFRVAVAEGCRVTARPSDRYFTDNGLLEGGDVHISFAGKSVDVHLSEGEIETTYELRYEEARLSTLIQIDSMWVRAETSDRPAIASYQPVRVDIEDLPTTFLTLNIPGVHTAMFELVVGGTMTQQHHAVAKVRGTFAVRMDQFSETARQGGSAELWCNWSNRRHLIARLRHRQLATTMVLIDDILLVDKVNISLDLDLHVSLDLAPWLPLALLRLPSCSDQVTLPDTVVGRGPITFTAIEHDPWNFGTSREVETLKEDNRFTIDQSITIESRSISDEFIFWTSGSGKCPDSYDALEFGLQKFDSLSQVQRGSRPELLYRQFADVTRGFERGFVDVAVHAGWSLFVHGRLLAEGLPAICPTDRRPVFDLTWNASPYLGLLQSGRRVRDPLLAEKIKSELGETAISILEIGEDPEGASGTFELSTLNALSLKPPAWLSDRRSTLFDEGGSYLDGSLRVARSIQLYTVRDEPELSPLVEQSEEILRTARQLLKGYGDGEGHKVLLSREISSGWKNLPAASLALAFIARLTPRLSSIEILTYDLYRDCYTDLAIVAPEIVEQDLLLAELWLQHWETHEKH